MKMGHRFVAGAVVFAFSLLLAARAAAAPSDFAFSAASEQETIYTFNSVPLSCEDFPAASDTYLWELKLAKIKNDFIRDLANNFVIVAFNSGSCDSLSDITNTLWIPPGAVYIHVDSFGLVDVDFGGAVPDFNTFNTSNDINLPFFDNLDFHMVYNPNGATIGGLKPGAGKLQVSGNANLCGAITSAQPQCLLLDLDFGGDEPDGDKEVGCFCVTPSVVGVDITSILSP